MSNPVRVVFTGTVIRIGTLAVLTSTMFSQVSMASWIDAATGQPVHTIPIGSPDPLSNSRTYRADPNHAAVGGKNLYWDSICQTWKDSATGNEVRTIPIGSPDPLSNSRTYRADPNHAAVGGKNLFWQPCPPPSTTSVSLPGGVEVSTSLGVSHTSTSFVSTDIFSAGVRDASIPERVNPSGTGFVGGIGASAALGELTNPFAGGTGGTNPMTRYAPEAKNAYAAYFPLKAPPKPQAPRAFWGIDGTVYFFTGGSQNITGIPGGPFGTATGVDTFKISNNVMFTLGGFVTVPVAPNWNVSLTGGVAELNQTIKYNCVKFCAVVPATPAFTASQERWATGGYIGGRLAMPVALPGLPGANIGLDYKHIFFGSTNVSLGAVATRQVNARLSPDMDLVTVRLGVPLR
jgi:hypothetical protein